MLVPLNNAKWPRVGDNLRWAFDPTRTLVLSQVVLSFGSFPLAHWSNFTGSLWR